MRVASRRSRKKASLSHLITNAVVNNGDDAQEIPWSPAIYRRRDIARIADADDR